MPRPSWEHCIKITGFMDFSIQKKLRFSAYHTPTGSITQAHKIIEGSMQKVTFLNFISTLYLCSVTVVGWETTRFEDWKRTFDLASSLQKSDFSRLFFSWWYVNDDVYQTPCSNLTKLKRRITSFIWSVDSETYKNVWTSAQELPSTVFRINAGQFWRHVKLIKNFDKYGVPWNNSMIKTLTCIYFDF